MPKADMALSNPYSTFSGYKWNVLVRSETAECGTFKWKERVGVTLTQAVMTCLDIWGIPILLDALQ